MILYSLLLYIYQYIKILFDLHELEMGRYYTRGYGEAKLEEYVIRMLGFGARIGETKVCNDCMSISEDSQGDARSVKIYLPPT